jgi:hypothetical protein
MTFLKAAGLSIAIALVVVGMLLAFQGPSHEELQKQLEFLNFYQGYQTASVGLLSAYNASLVGDYRAAKDYFDKWIAQNDSLGLVFDSLSAVIEAERGVE